MTYDKDRRMTPEQAARAACEGLGYTDQQLRDFVEWFIGNEARRAGERERELGSAKRNKALADAIIHVAVSPWRERYADKDYHDDTSSAVSRGFDAEDQRDADTYQNQRNRGET